MRSVNKEEDSCTDDVTNPMIVRLGSSDSSSSLAKSLSSLDVIPPLLTVIRRNDYADDDDDDGGTKTGPRRHSDEDGGWAWTVFAFVFLGRVIVNGTLLTFNIYFSLFLDLFHESRSTTAFIGSVMWALYDGSGLISAFIVERCGPRASIVLGSLVLTGSLLLSTLATDTVHLIFSFGMLVGFGGNLVSMAFVVGLRLYFRKYVYLTQGVSTSGAGIGMFAFGFALPNLLDSFGWRGAMVVHAGVLLNLSVVGCVVFPVRKGTFRSVPLAAVPPPAPPPAFRHSSRHLFSTRLFWCVLSAYVCFNLSYVIGVVLYKDYVIMVGLEEHFSSGLFAFGAGDIVGRLGSGLIASLDRVNPLVFNAVVHAADAVVLFLFMAVSSRDSLLIVTFLYGCCTGCANGLFFILPCHLYSSSESAFLVAFAILSLAAGVGSFCGTPFAGFIIDQTQSYNGALTFAGLVSVLASAFLLVVFVIQSWERRRAVASLKMEDIISPPSSFVSPQEQIKL